MFNSITSIFFAILMFFFNIFTPVIPEQKTSEELSEMPMIFNKYELGDELYVITMGQLDTTEKLHMAICLQGLVARTNPCIFIITNSADVKYIEEIKNSGVNVIYNDENGKNWTLESLLEKFKSYITDNSYVLYRASDKGEGLNMATNLSAIHGWLSVPESLEKIAIDAGLTLKEDFSDDKYNIFFQWKIFNKYKKDFNSNAVVHERYDIKALRDLAIQQKFFTFYIDDDDSENWFRKLVLDYFGRNTLVLGWAKYEVAYVDCASSSDDLVIPSDFCYNNSYYTSFDCELKEQPQKETKAYTDDTKHYATILFSDGDNVQWIQNGFPEFLQRQNLETDFPMTWTFPPLLHKFSPWTFNNVYSQATQNDYFVSGVSGAGYIHSTQYSHKGLSEFSDLTASAMMKSGLEYVTFLDKVPTNPIKEAELTRSLEYFARYDNIKGGVLYLDPGRYAGGNGKVYFVNDKPFVSARFSLWHPSNEKTDVTKEWIEEQAETVNKYKADIHSINGYSIINVHPWSVSIENLEYFVNCLDEDIVLVTVDELLEMINNNIPHINSEVM